MLRTPLARRRNGEKVLFSCGRVVTFVLATLVLHAVTAGTAMAVDITVVNHSSTEVTLNAQPYTGVTGCTLSTVKVSASRTHGLRLPFCAVQSITLTNIFSTTRGHISCVLNSDMTPTSENHYDRPARSAYFWGNLPNDKDETYRLVCEDKPN